MSQPLHLFARRLFRPRAVSDLRNVVTPSKRLYAVQYTNRPSPSKQPTKPEPLDPSHPTGEPLQQQNPTGALPKAGSLIFAALAAGLGFYTLQLYLAARRPCTNPSIALLGHQKDVASRYDYTASSFDSEVGFSELLMGINGIRKKLARQCKGDVLEVSCGTGRNLGYYDIEGPGAKVKSLGFIDLSPAMVEVCRKKWEALYANALGTPGNKIRDSGLRLRFMTGSALDSMPLAPTSNGESRKKYETIIQTMGLCSTPSPIALLTNMANHLDTSNPQSRILLLEHGRSYMPWLNNILDNSAEKHAELHGCWFNRDIGELVREAAKQSGLEVVRERRHHFGTTWVFELKPTEETVKKARTAAKSGTSSVVKQVKNEVGEKKSSGGWFSAWT